MTSNESQTQEPIVHVLDQPWDILIILDACRYDIFKDEYGTFLKGKLTKYHSIGTNTAEWYNKSFPDFYEDIIIISGNPFCNGKGVTQRGFNGINHFYKVIDAWDHGYDKTLDVIHPEAVNKNFFKYQTLYPEKRFIIHYIQPHSPYVSVPKKYKPKKVIKNNLKQRLRRVLYNNILKKMRLPNTMAWFISDLFHMNSYIAQLYIDKGWQGIQDAYIDNLRFVLPYVKKITDICSDKKIIVSSDHGERLGELNMFGHGGKRDKAVIEVPWLEIGK